VPIFSFDASLIKLCFDLSHHVNLSLMEVNK